MSKIGLWREKGRGEREEREEEGEGEGGDRVRASS